MSNDRGQRNRGDGKDQRDPPPARFHLVRLARGVELRSYSGESGVLTSPNGKVQLNDGAVIILRLCDGSRTSAEIIAEVMRASLGETLAADIADFLDVARARGWIVSE